jgi:conjugative transfer region protein TrbK
MSAYLTPLQFARIAGVAFVGLAITVAVIQSRHSKNGTILTPMEPAKADALVGELARCRTITLDDLGLLEPCRNIWAENHSTSCNQANCCISMPSQHRIHPRERRRTRTQSLSMTSTSRGRANGWHRGH